MYNRLAGRRPAILNQSDRLVSAVLLPLVEKDGKCHILFEVRSRNLKRQPGEICFPGGVVEKGNDPDPLATALRETTEELGIDSGDIRIIGPLDILASPMGALIYPYAGEIKTSGITPNAREVEELFLVPVDFFLAEPPYATHVEVATRYKNDFPLHKVPPTYREGWQVRTSYPMYFYEYGKYFIWGLTGIILHNFLSLCWPDHPVLKMPPKKWREK
ncbi:MAG: CoA pyrophosphatase [Peptococcaceae bacterium]|nr:CoA pyrophosphatase [Peptococcaceae bacterium]